MPGRESDAAPGSRWEDRCLLASVLRAGIVLAPFAVAVAAVQAADAVFSPRSWTLWQELALMVPVALAAGWRPSGSPGASCPW